ncbi:N5-glutamine methyltransferase family protein [Paenibacillus sp. D9]|uniref:N5-glutamine methyltransferase family protein n=1 Tax=Paenibacillus sp. D9 TaxID=665792 RepID=UPI00067602E5|nr:HemK/PrmC family methyltransferase [Paenibacillus sp. D9]
MSENDQGRETESFRQAAGASIQAARKLAETYLDRCGVEEAGDNASLLLQHVLGLNRAELLRDGREAFPAERLAAWEEAITRKGRGEPAQYIAGEQWFYGRPFAVTPAVLIPRPETELLVEAVLQAADRLWPQAAGSAGTEASAEALPGSAKPAASALRSAGLEAPASAAAPVVLDVGTGSGAIAVTLAAERPVWRVHASDLSPEALRTAEGNALRLGAELSAFIEGDLLQPFVASGGGSMEGLEIDVLVSNPPYIPAGDLPGLQREVREFEPRLALDGGEDGLNPYRAMAVQLKLLTRLPSVVGFELGMGQARQVAALLEEIGHWDDISIVTDYGGIERHVVAVRSPGSE